MEISVEKIYEWIDAISPGRSKKSISREFSDCVLTAQLLKHFYPRLVDVHNYPPANTLSRKVINWTTLNRKVLTKIGLQLNEQKIEQLARATEGALDDFLQILFDKINTRQQEKILQLQQQEASLEPSLYIVKKKGQCLPVSGVTIATDSYEDSRVILVTEKIVSANELEKKLTELAEKEEIISTLSSKISHYEQLLKLKDERIKNLEQQSRLWCGGKLNNPIEE